jgi:hypothetical protein
MEWTLAGEALDGCLTRLGMHARVAHLLSPGHEPIIQLLEGGDALGFGLEQEPFADVAAEPLLFSATLRSVRPAVDKANAEDGALRSRAVFAKGAPLSTCNC